MNVLGVAAFVVSAGLHPPVKICMETGAGDHWVIARAEAITTRMFAQIGVAVAWRHSANCDTASGKPLIIRLSTGAPEEQFPGALAYSRLSDGTHIEVFYDRVNRTVEPPRVPALVAHVLAHEIGHLLEGIGRHSAEGVMKAHWDERDFLEMSDKPLPFASEDVELIRRGATRKTLP